MTKIYIANQKILYSIWEILKQHMTHFTQHMKKITQHITKIYATYKKNYIPHMRNSEATDDTFYTTYDYKLDNIWLENRGHITKQYTPYRKIHRWCIFHCRRQWSNGGSNSCAQAFALKWFFTHPSAAWHLLQRSTHPSLPTAINIFEVTPTNDSDLL